MDLDKTLFVVSSKSGGTVETLSHMRYFYERTGGNGSQFVAVTDPGSGLVDLAGERGFRRVFENDPNIGGRYSVLSYFGLVPAALMGVDVEALLQSSREAEENCNSFDSSSHNSGLWLGLAMGELARQGRDKLTFVIGEPIDSFGLWVEQLIAESTGKEGTGHPAGGRRAAGRARRLRRRPRVRLPAQRRRPRRGPRRQGGRAARGRPGGAHADREGGRGPRADLLLRRVRHGRGGVGARDQPVRPAQRAGGQGQHRQRCWRPTSRRTIEDADDDALRELLRQAEPPRYVAILGYVAPSEEFDEAVLELRAAIRDATKATTTFGYGPRYLHSTGQFHKGGPPSGLFLQLVHEPGGGHRDPRGRLLASPRSRTPRPRATSSPCATTACRPSGYAWRATTRRRRCGSSPSGCAGCCRALSLFTEEMCPRDHKAR